MPEDVYRELVLPSDQAVLGQMPHEAWFNVVHLCGSKLHFDLINELPSQVVSWSIHNLGTPTLSQGRTLSSRAVMGGLGQRKSLLYGPPAEVQAEARRAIADTGGRGLLLAPGCSVPPRVRDINLAAIGEAVAA
jgi:uroporphyrinogen decarboxylase